MARKIPDENRYLKILTDTLDITFRNDDKILIESSKTLRLVIGILGMALPLFLWLSLYVFSGHCEPLDSISHYFFTKASTFFIGIISVLAIFFMIYKGYDSTDFFVSSLAGLAAILLLLLPTGNIVQDLEESHDYIVTVWTYVHPQSDYRQVAHFIFAALFLGSLAYMSICQFTKSDLHPGERKSEKILRNRMYRVFGSIMILALVLIFLGTKGYIMPVESYNRYHLTFWMEAVAVESFGISWLIKGGAICKDKS